MRWRFQLKRKNLGDGARGYHSYSWLHYGYLQQGRYKDANRLLRDMVGFTKKAPNRSARSYLTATDVPRARQAPRYTGVNQPDNVSQLLEKGPPTAVIGKNTGVKHFRGGQEQLGRRLFDAAALRPRGIAVVHSRA